ncbi:MAG: T9SS type A sorting domain-containing protein, partial [Bacteroidota bacterium]
NSIFTEFGVDGLRLGENSFQRYIDSDFTLPGNLWFDFGDGNDPNNFVRVDGDNLPADAIAQVVTKLLAEGNEVSDPLLNGVSRAADGGLDPRPGSGSPARVGAVEADDDFFQSTTYRGAFSPFTNWALGWTHMDEQGYFGDLDGDGETIVITDADLVGGEEYTWTSDNLYQLDGYVYLEEGGCLNIEAGTRIEALRNSTTNEATSLIITRGAQIKAEGTAEAPIVFTSVEDDGSLDPSQPTGRGLWGGLIILGNGFVGDENGVGTAEIEGIVGEPRTQYGGGANPNNAESSGILRYVSVRYGGAELAPDNEINGITLGGVGSGTEIDFIEVFGNLDDGIELFGGAVDIKHASVIFCGDDSFDTDQAWDGRGQFWFSIQLPNDPSGNNQNGGEHDGSEDSNSDGGPEQIAYNATYIGMGSDMDNGGSNTGLRIKSSGAFTYGNSIFTSFGVDGLRLGENSYQRFLDGDFTLPSNVWFDFGDGNDPSQFVRVDGNVPANAIDLVVAELVAQNNDVTDPQLFRINRAASTNMGVDGLGTDPRPLDVSVAATGASDVPADDFFEQTTYRGAFPPEAVGDDYWVTWTHAFEQGYLVDQLVETIDLGSNNEGVVLGVPSPNPTSGITTLNVEIPAASNVELSIYDQLGRKLQTRDLGRMAAGENQYTLDVQTLPNGHYFLLLDTSFGIVSQRMVINR